MICGMTPIESACDQTGSQRALASLLNVTPATVNQWCSGIRAVPEDRCPSIEKATEGAVACEALRPDVVWIRIPDPDWPHPLGRPLVDHSAKLGADTPAQKEAA